MKHSLGAGAKGREQHVIKNTAGGRRGSLRHKAKAPSTERGALNQSNGLQPPRQSMQKPRGENSEYNVP
eukprot:2527852-Lingulodinium_polyedra.AAC.1